MFQKIQNLQLQNFDGSNDCAKIGNPLFFEFKGSIINSNPIYRIILFITSDCVILLKKKLNRLVHLVHHLMLVRQTHDRKLHSNS